MIQTRNEKEKAKHMGRVMPRLDQEEHERELMRIATKGIVELFQTVADFQ